MIYRYYLDVEDLRKFARDNGAEEIQDMNHWDVNFWSERIRESKYDLNEVGFLLLLGRVPYQNCEIRVCLFNESGFMCIDIYAYDFACLINHQHDIVPSIVSSYTGNATVYRFLHVSGRSAPVFLAAEGIRWSFLPIKEAI